MSFMELAKVIEQITGIEAAPPTDDPPYVVAYNPATDAAPRIVKWDAARIGRAEPTEAELTASRLPALKNAQKRHLEDAFDESTSLIELSAAIANPRSTEAASLAARVQKLADKKRRIDDVRTDTASKVEAITWESTEE